VPDFKFLKYEGLGNDFILIDQARVPVETGPVEARKLCDRRRGIGADGILLIVPPWSGEAHAGMRPHAGMRLLNADGSEAEMCGNGIRCLAKFLGDNDASLDEVLIDTAAGLKMCMLERDDEGVVRMVSVDMGAAGFDRSMVGMKGSGRFVDQTLEGIDEELRFTAVSMGNPHLVTFAQLDRERMTQLGPKLENHREFPQRINAGFAQAMDDGVINLTVWERGCGFTDACGTGACAATAAACMTGIVEYDRPVRVKLPGGDLIITVVRDTGNVIMKGPATFVFHGEVHLDG